MFEDKIRLSRPLSICNAMMRFMKMGSGWIMFEDDQASKLFLVSGVYMQFLA